MQKYFCKDKASDEKSNETRNESNISYSASEVLAQYSLDDEVEPYNREDAGQQVINLDNLIQASGTLLIHNKSASLSESNIAGESSTTPENKKMEW